MPFGASTRGESGYSVSGAGPVTSDGHLWGRPEGVFGAEQVA